MKKLLIMLTIMLMILSACQEVPEPEPEPEPEKRALTFADIDTLDIYDNEVGGSIFAEHELTILNIWATYCGPCIMEMPYLGEMAADMPEGTQIVGLVLDALDEDTLALARQIAEETGAAFTHLQLDQFLFTFVYYNVVGVPTTVFVDSSGNLVGNPLVGAQPREVYEAELAARLEQLEEVAL